MENQNKETLVSSSTKQNDPPPPVQPPPQQPPPPSVPPPPLGPAPPPAAVLPPVTDRTEAEEQICRKYIWGTCDKHQTQCRFKHIREIEYMKKTLRFCHDYQNHGCSRVTCSYLHTSRDEENNFKKFDITPSILLERYLKSEKKIAAQMEAAKASKAVLSQVQGQPMTHQMHTQAPMAHMMPPPMQGGVSQHMQHMPPQQHQGAQHMQGQITQQMTGPMPQQMQGQMPPQLQVPITQAPLATQMQAPAAQVQAPMPTQIQGQTHMQAMSQHMPQQMQNPMGPLMQNSIGQPMQGPSMQGAMGPPMQNSISMPMQVVPPYMQGTMAPQVPMMSQMQGPPPSQSQMMIGPPPSQSQMMQSPLPPQSQMIQGPMSNHYPNMYQSQPPPPPARIPVTQHNSTPPQHHSPQHNTAPSIIVNHSAPSLANNHLPQPQQYSVPQAVHQAAPHSNLLPSTLGSNYGTSVIPASPTLIFDKTKPPPMLNNINKLRNNDIINMGASSSRDTNHLSTENGIYGCKRRCIDVNDELKAE